MKNYQVVFGSIRWNLQIEDEPLLQFLKSYFVPFFSFEEGEVADPICTLTVKIESVRDRLQDFEGETIKVDGSKGFLATEGIVIERENGVREVRLLPMDALVRIDREAKTIDVCGESTERLMVPVLRVLEDITLLEAERQGGIVLHASGVTVDGHAVLASGDKGAGKTSILCHLLRDFACQMLTNDNAVIQIENDKVIARGWPSFYKIEPGTLSSISELAPYFPKERLKILTSSEAVWKDKEKVALYSLQGAEIFGVGIDPIAEWKAIYFPKFTREEIGIADWSDEQRLFELLKHNLQGSFNKNHPNWHNYNSVEPSDILYALRQMVPLLTERVACYTLQWAPSLTQLLAEVDVVRAANKTLLACAEQQPDINACWSLTPPILEPLLYKERA